MTTAKRPQIHITREFNAPRELVFNAWTSAEHLKRWYAPTGCELSHCEVDFRKGGALFLCIKAPNGYECWCKGVILEFDKPEKLVYSLQNVNAKGNPVTAADLGMDSEWPTLTVITVTFADVNGKTAIALHQDAPLEVAKRTGAYPSWLSMFDRLDVLLKSKI
jgi:uncharacterized protein YndB with AHSA1/START domain